MASTTCEKLVKYTIKSISKKYQLDYDDLKLNLKKVVKTAKNYDQTVLGMMEEIMDLSSVASQEELEDFDIEVLKMYCRIKELDDSLSDKKIRAQVWNNMQEEFELSDDETDSEDESEDETEDESETEEPEPKIVEIVEPEKKVKKVKKEVTIVE